MNAEKGFYGEMAVIGFQHILLTVCRFESFWESSDIVKLRQGSGKDWQGMAVKVKGLKA